MSSNIMLRHRVVKLMRRFLEDIHNFVEVLCFLFCHCFPYLNLTLCPQISEIIAVFFFNIID